MDAVQVEGLWEHYRVKRLGMRTLKQVVAFGGRRRAPQQWALRDVTFEVPRGQMLGVIGANGSGKSTLLRCLAGIYRPSRGVVRVRGRSTSLIDLTAGFQMDLSARDNVFLSAAIYGIPRADVSRLFPRMMEFADLAEHADEPLRSFSTGMAMRLGFSVAVSFEPEVLLVDEVLAVGDEWFKTRCLGKVAEMRQAGTTVVFVSHELALVESLCDRVIVLAAGEVTFDGSPSDAIRRYCDDLGVSMETALSRPAVDPRTLRRAASAWKKK